MILAQIEATVVSHDTLAGFCDLLNKVLSNVGDRVVEVQYSTCSFTSHASVATSINNVMFTALILHKPMPSAGGVK